MSNNQTTCICGGLMKQVCSTCKATYYCSKECQKKDWKVHKKICSTSLPLPEIKAKEAFIRGMYSKYLKYKTKRNHEDMTRAEIDKESAEIQGIIHKNSDDIFKSYMITYENEDYNIISRKITHILKNGSLKPIVNGIMDAIRKKTIDYKKIIYIGYLVYVTREFKFITKGKYITILFAGLYGEIYNTDKTPIYAFYGINKNGIIDTFIKLKYKPCFKDEDLFDGIAHEDDKFTYLPFDRLSLNNYITINAMQNGMQMNTLVTLPTHI